MYVIKFYLLQILKQCTHTYYFHIAVFFMYLTNVLKTPLNKNNNYALF